MITKSKIIRPNENKYNADLGKWLDERRRQDPTRGGWEVIKHCDRFTIGIPDFSVGVKMVTQWFEVKILDKDERLLFPDWADNKVQLERLIRMGGFYHVYDPFRGCSILVDAWLVKHLLLHKTSLGEEYRVAGQNWEGLYQKIDDNLIHANPYVNFQTGGEHAKL